MDYVDSLVSRNENFARSGFVSGLKMMPTKRAVIIGCIDPRVDPAQLFSLESGEAVVIRNAGGRVTPGVAETFSLLEAVVESVGHKVGEGWNLIVMQHTNCGIVNCWRHAPALLAKDLGVEESDLAGMSIDDPRKAVEMDIAKLREDPRFPGELTVTGMVYDVTSGLTQVVVPSATLR